MQEPTDFLSNFLSKREIKKLNKLSKSNKSVIQSRSLRGSQEIVSENLDAQRQPKRIVPKTMNQVALLEGLEHKQMVIAKGSAGTGKTYLSMTFAANQLLQRKIDKIIITRPNVGVGKTIGLLPGTCEDKMLTWMGPSVAVLKSVLGSSLYEYMIKKEQIIMQPIEHVRGASWGSEDESVFVFIDESQNLEIEEVKALTTRIGDNCQIVFAGDTSQSDLKHTSGLKFLMQAIENSEEIKQYSTVIEFGIDDIVRSNLCKAWVKYFYETGF